MKEIKDTYTATSKNFCSQWDRSIFSPKLISHKIINLKRQTFMKADKLKGQRKHSSAASSVQMKMQIHPLSYQTNQSLRFYIKYSKAMFFHLTRICSII